jgi:hypothetical protein
MKAILQMIAILTLELDPSFKSPFIEMMDMSMFAIQLV